MMFLNSKQLILYIFPQKNSVIQTKSLLKRPKANVLITVVTHNQELPMESLASFKLDWVSFPEKTFFFPLNIVIRKTIHDASRRLSLTHTELFLSHSF